MSEIYSVAVITASDRCAAGLQTDLSGPAIVKALAPISTFTLVEQVILPDDHGGLSARMQELCDSGAVDLILTTCGTGLAPRDQMPEATLAIAQRLVPGIAEALRYHSLQITKRGILSRGVAVIRNQTLIINLPGSPKAVRESLDYLTDQLPHALGLLKERPTENRHHE